MLGQAIQMPLTGRPRWMGVGQAVSRACGSQGQPQLQRAGLPGPEGRGVVGLALQFSASLCLIFLPSPFLYKY